MTDQKRDNKYLFNVYITASSGSINLPFPIAKQNVTLRSYRLKFDTAAHSRDCEYVNFNCQWLANSISNTYNPGLYLPTQEAIVTLEHPNFEIMASDKIEASFNYNITGGNLVGFQNALLTFEYYIN